MTNEISTKTKCLLIRDDIEIWLTDEEAEKIKMVLRNESKPKFIDVAGQFLAVSVILGILDGNLIEEKKRLKRGEWKCQFNFWHTRGQECGHTQKIIKL